MNKKKSSIDGFVPRRTGSQIGERHLINSSASLRSPARKELRSQADVTSKRELGRADKRLGAARHEQSAVYDHAELNETLNSLDDLDEGIRAGRPTKKISRKERRRIKKEERTRGQKIRRRIILAVVWIVIAGLVGAGGYLAFKTLQATGNVLNGNIFDLIQNEPLKQDANGRSNFLIVGTSEDDPGHDGGHLTDSIMVLSVDQKNKNAFTFSIPRDLYVEYGKACLSGYRGKINAYFNCAAQGDSEAADQERLKSTREFIGNIVGLDIQYGVKVNYTVMRDVVNAIGGTIDLTIESRHPSGVLDANFDWKCGATLAQRKQNCPPRGHFIDFPNGPITLNAEQALYLAQARGHQAPTYGLEQSNFDRERNQQKIIVAIRDKAMSSGTLTNIGKVTGLIDALGNNLRTNVEMKEVRTLLALAQDIPSEAIQSIDLYAGDNRIFTTGDIGGASSVYPSAGVGNYSELRSYIKKQLNANPVSREAANVTILNGSGVGGIAQTLAEKLEGQGFTIDEIANAPEGDYPSIEIYQIDTTMAATAAKLKELYNVTIKTTDPPVSVTGDTSFVIIIGEASVVQ